MVGVSAPAPTGHPWWHYAAVLLAPVVAMVLTRATTGRRSLADSGRAWWSAARRAPRSVQLLSLGSLAVASIHLGVCPEHFQEALLYGVFFVVLATLQLTWGAVVVARPTRIVLFAGALLNGATIILWLVSRTSGLPVGPEPWEPETFGWLDIAASAIELAIVLLALRLAFATPRPVAAGSGSMRARLRAIFPVGTPLPEDVWRQRHRWIRGIFWAQLPAITIFALFRGYSAELALLMPLALGPFVVLIQVFDGNRRAAMVLTSLGLLSCSAEFVYLSGGSVEMHFHYFVMVGLITLYQDWWPFLVAIAYVVLQHGVVGALDPRVVYDEPAAINDPWTWAGIHGFFILGMSAAGIASWKLNEVSLGHVAKGADELHRTLSLLSSTLDATADGILVVDAEGKISSYNRRFVELWGVPQEILDSRDDDQALAFVLDQLADPQAFTDSVRELYAHPEAECQDVLHFKDGRTFDRFSTPQRVNGVTVGRVWSFRDVTQQHHLQKELAHQAFHDSLTDLANQALFRDRVDHALVRSERRDGRLAVMFLDLDGFKRVNDSLGHRVGDELLTAMAARLRVNLRTIDTAARMGGDEFAVLLEDLESRQEAIDVAERVIGALRQPFHPGGREIVISASIGIVFATADSTSEQLLRNADLAMYTAKRRHNGSYEVYETEMHAQAVDRLELEGDLRRGLSRGEFVVLYQPIVALGNGRIAGVEALVRWQHPTRGLMTPASFIQVAEETGLIRPLGRHVLEVACRQTRTWQDIPEVSRLSVSVNLSPRQLLHEEIVDQVSDVLRSSGLPPNSLTLEITEGAMIEDAELAIEKLRQLKMIGVRLAVDDFGTGYSSLSYLEQFPVDVLKIDRSFIAPMVSKTCDSSLASAIVSLARSLRLQAVAEGVETAEQVRILADFGCDFAQGYYFSKPVDAEQIGALLRPARASVTKPTVLSAGT